MNVLKINTSPSFEIVPREKISILENLSIELISEFSQSKQTVNIGVTELSNENYLIQLSTFPISKEGEKFSYTIKNELNKIVSLGKLIVLGELQNIQDYSKKTNKKFYN